MCIRDRYTNDHVMSFARAWTGFDRQAFRGNLEAVSGPYSSNSVDPMQIKSDWRDSLPKTNLDKGFLGDGYPLCDAFAERSFLLKGARFVYTGPNSAESFLDQYDDGDKRLAPDSATSQLYTKLCNPDGGGKCQFAAEVTLDADLPCDGAECRVDTASVIKIVESAGTAFYSYAPAPCVRLSFFGGGTKIRTLARRRATTLCANPSTRVAGAVCCPTGQPTGTAQGECEYYWEKTSFATMNARCSAASKVSCGDYTNGPDGRCAYQWNWPTSFHSWTSTPCKLQAQVHSSGYINIVHEGAADKRFVVNSPYKFLVDWQNSQFPLADACPAECTTVGDTCLCDVTVTDTPVFTDLSGVTSKEQLLSQLHIGSPPAGSFDVSTIPEVEVSPGSIGIDTVFKTSFHGDIVYLVNRKSTVSIGSFAFRNPPQFMQTNTNQFTGGTSQAEHETESLLDHLFHHRNTAPFISIFLIKRLVTSNPSPRYVAAVTQAFRTGEYNGRVYSGKYGDLGASIAAILLDREASSSIMDVDPTHGRLREPILKVLHMMRSLEYEPNNNQEVEMQNMNQLIGQQNTLAPSVFGFYLSEYAPPGRIAEAGLVSPEAEIGTAPQMIGFLNGINSLVNHGLTGCSGGFGSRRRYSCGVPVSNKLAFEPESTATAQIVSEMDLLLTRGRLNAESTQVLQTAYERTLLATTRRRRNNNVETPEALALKAVQKLITATPEFHTSAVNQQTDVKRGSVTNEQSAVKPFKSIVIIHMAGGADTHSLLIPHSDCASGDLFAQYETVRGNIALEKSSLLTIDASDSDQPCDTMGLHGSLPVVKTLYDEGDAALLANIGVLVEPVSKIDFTTKTETRKPPGLFSHNIMVRSTQSVHAQLSSAKGILGRMLGAVESAPSDYRGGAYSITGNQKIVEGPSAPTIISQSGGVVRYNNFEELGGDIAAVLGANKSESVFADTYAGLMDDALLGTQRLGAILANVTLNASFASTGLSRQMEQVATLIGAREALGEERMVFVVSIGGFDTHSDTGGVFTGKMTEINQALASFVQEMKAQGVWDGVVVGTISDFARTLTSNGRGTDHAWAGNHLLLGGSVKGSQILGKFPSALDETGPEYIGRGRLLPTTSWEALWQGLAQWFGVDPAKMGEVLPNAANFPANELFTEAQLFD
eukprot:TRINITY_DN2349_c0_g4_i2.p1 TRINITY_DN2349_c0_g4~~TRINITY_DN2349_c0_g4_i2.p1  ORF type:complete len:1161 (-),score=234.81 TRINITY_DN2349_c0_g4_i2:206-3688(-)